MWAGQPFSPLGHYSPQFLDEILITSRPSPTPPGLEHIECVTDVPPPLALQVAWSGASPLSALDYFGPCGLKLPGYL